MDSNSKRVVMRPGKAPLSLITCLFRPVPSSTLFLSYFFYWPVSELSIKYPPFCVRPPSPRFLSPVPPGNKIGFRRGNVFYGHRNDPLKTRDSLPPLLSLSHSLCVSLSNCQSFHSFLHFIIFTQLWLSRW